MYAADVIGCMYFGVMFVDIEQKQTGITSDTICDTTHFWREFEIREKKVIYFSSLIDIN